MSSDIEQAEKVTVTLRSKRDAAVAHGVSLGEERGKISFAAHTGDKAARQKLDKLNAELALHDSELRSLDAAISEAAARVSSAQAAEVAAVNRQKAAEAITLVKELGECFPYLDRKLAEAANALIAINDGVQKLHSAGFQFPSDAQLRIGVAAIIQSWTHRLPKHFHDQLRDGFEFLAPGRRQTAVECWTKIQASIGGQITQRLGKTESEAA
jgi:hypothetical protein